MALGTICAGTLSAVTLWVLFGFPPEPRRSDADTLGSQFEARKGESLGGVGPLNVTGASRQDFEREHGAQGQPVAEATVPSIASSGASPPAQSDDSAGASDDRSLGGSGSSSATAVEPAKTAKETQTEAAAGADRHQEISRTLTHLRPRMQCNVDLCAATYKSFHAPDCTYQPNGGGPRSICELSTRPADARSQTSRAATDARFEAKDTRVAETAEEVPKSATPARAGPQCNVDLCAATYKSFNAADCTYEPYGGGPRHTCER